MEVGSQVIFWLIFAAFIVGTLIFVSIAAEHTDPEVDEYCSRLDELLDREERERRGEA